MSKKHQHAGNESCTNPDCYLFKSENKSKWDKALQAGKDAGMIKVHIGTDNRGIKEAGIAGENLWATPIDSHTAIIENNPFFASDVSLKDIVETEDDGFVREYVKTVQHMTETICIKYHSNTKDGTEIDEATKSRYKALYNAIEKRGLHCEGAFPGIMMVAYSIDLTQEEAIEKINDASAEVGHNVEIVLS